MKNNGSKNAPERAQHSDPPVTPTEAPAMEQRPESARLAQDSGLRAEVCAIGPAYEFNMVTIRDRAGNETRWLVPFGRKLTGEDLYAYKVAHLLGETENGWIN